MSARWREGGVKMESVNLDKLKPLPILTFKKKREFEMEI
jgi:hypothetical protein